MILSLLWFKIEKIHHFLKNIGVMIAGISLISMMLLIVIDVALRNLFNIIISETYQVVQYYLMPIAVFPALAYTYSSGVLPRFGDLIDRLAPIHKKIASHTLLIIEIIIAILLIYFGFRFAITGMLDKMAVPIGSRLFPLYPLYFLFPLGFILVLLEVLISHIRQFIYPHG